MLYMFFTILQSNVSNGEVQNSQLFELQEAILFTGNITTFAGIKLFFV